jgi:hypothetical protein
MNSPYTININAQGNTDIISDGEVIGTLVKDKDSAPKYVRLDMMYRDGGNWKTSDSVGYTNTQGYTEESIDFIINQLIGTTEVLAAQFDLHNLAPTSHPLEEVSPEQHCYMEISGIDYSALPYHSVVICDEAKDIDVIIQNVLKGGSDSWFAFEKSLEASHLNDAKKTLRGAGYTVLSEEEVSEQRAREIPAHIDYNAVLAILAIAPTNPKLVDILQENGVNSNDVYDAMTWARKKVQ